MTSIVATLTPSETRTGITHQGYSRPMWKASPQAHALDAARPETVHLTPRQREVLLLLCEGLPNKLICRRLEISTATVKVHVASILRELGVANRLQAVVAAHRFGLV